MISYAQFSKLRLATFCPDEDIEEVEDFEFMNDDWEGETLGFTEWLRLASDPKVLRSLALDFNDFPPAAASQVLQTLELPIRPGMTIAELKPILGEPIEEQKFAKDRITYEFVLAGPPQYNISCTVLNKGGLTYLVVMRP